MNYTKVLYDKFIWKVFHKLWTFKLIIWSHSSDSLTHPNQVVIQRKYFDGVEKYFPAHGKYLEPVQAGVRVTSNCVRRLTFPTFPAFPGYIPHISHTQLRYSDTLLHMRCTRPHSFQGEIRNDYPFKGTSKCISWIKDT